MLKKLVLILAVAAFAFAGTVPSGPHYKVTLSQTSTVKGTELKAGDYQISIVDSTITITNEFGKNPVAVSAKVETQDKKFDATAVRFITENGKNVISEIRLGGTKTRLVFN